MRFTSAMPTPTTAVARMRRVEVFARFLVEHFAVVDAVGNALGVEDDGGGHDRTGERAAPGLIDAGHGSAVQLQLGSFQLEGRWLAAIRRQHSP